VIPQISVILGPCAGGAVYSPALTDFVFVVDKISKMFITGPEVIKTVLERGDQHGGPRRRARQAEVSGNAHFFAESEQECFEQIKRLVTFIPWNNREEGRPVPGEAAAVRVRRSRRSSPTRPASRTTSATSSGPSATTATSSRSRSTGRRTSSSGSRGWTARRWASSGNQPAVLAGVLDVDASDKAARFIRFCDAFNIPLITLVDLPGYLPGVDQEHAGVIRHGAKILYAYSEATVPKITVILRKAYGGGYIAMCSRHLGADFVFAWPGAEIAVMGSEGAANIIFRKEIAAADPEAHAAGEDPGVQRQVRQPLHRRRDGHVDA
jgi:acetyl-CoA carboxylase carboxyltransferase component